MQRLNFTRFGYAPDDGNFNTDAWYRTNEIFDYKWSKGYKLNSPGHAPMTCPSHVWKQDWHQCRTEITGKGPNMWDPNHKLYTVWRLEEDRLAATFDHQCVDAEFPHFPYDHYVKFSAHPFCFICSGKLSRTTGAISCISLPVSLISSSMCGWFIRASWCLVISLVAYLGFFGLS